MRRGEHWPHTLDERLAEPVEPTCPGCVFNKTCPTRIQKGINQLFVDGTYVRPQDCMWWKNLAAVTRKELQIDPPDTADELLEAMGERMGIREEA